VAKTFVLFNMHIEVESDVSECRVLLHSHFSDEVLANSVVLFCVNLDDNTKQFIPNLDLSTFRIQKNEHGYALIAFSRPSQRIVRSKYDIKILFEGAMQHRMIDMALTVDFRVGYVNNFENSLLRDEITSEDGAKFVFLELQFDTKEECGAFGKIVEFIDTESKAVMATYSSTQSVMYIPQMRLVEDRKLAMCIRIDKELPGSNPEALYKDGSIDCMVRIISDAKIRLFPDNSQTVQIDAIKSEWHAQKGRAEKAKEARQKYLAKKKEIFELTSENISPQNQSELKRLESGDKPSIVADDEFWQNDKEKTERETAENKQEIAEEKQFRSAQTDKFAEHNAMIDETLKASHENTKNYDSEDVTKRGQLRTERLEWAEQLSTMADLDEELMRNMADLKQRLTTFSDEIEKMVDEARNTEPPKPPPKGKKSKKAKPKKKKKGKISKPATDVSLSALDVPKLTEQCITVEKTVPAWRYAKKTDKCNLGIFTILYDVLTQCNSQFAALVQNKREVPHLDDDCFKECCDQYTALCAAVFQAIETVSKWRPQVPFEGHIKIQLESDDIIIAAMFCTLQIALPVEAIDAELSPQTPKGDEEAPVDKAESEEVEIDVDQIAESLSSLELKEGAVMLKEHRIELKADYVEYVKKVEEWIQHKRGEEQQITKTK